jgi:hypothetical protein
MPIDSPKTLSVILGLYESDPDQMIDRAQADYLPITASLM